MLVFVLNTLFIGALNTTGWMCVQQREVLSLQKSIQGSSFDTEYAIKYVALSIVPVV